MTDLEKAKELLVKSEYTCVLQINDKTYTSSLRGVKPLVLFYKSGKDFSGFSAADKVVGKGAAFLYILLDVKEVYAGIISKPALSILNLYGIKVEYNILVEHIINRKGDGICPFEQAVMYTENKYEAYKLIEEKMQELNIKNEE